MRSLLFGRKAQLTFFVIVGILVVVAISATVMLFNYKPSQPQNSGSQVTVNNAKLSLQQCSEQEFEKSVKLAALNGGYINLTSDIKNANAYFTPYPDSPIVLWVKNGNSYYPSLDTIQGQIASDLKGRITQNCLSDIPASQTIEPDVSVVLGSSKNTATIDFHTTITLPQSNTKITTMQVQNTLPFVDTYNQANSILSKLQQDNVLNTLNYNLLSLDAEIPKSGVDVSCNQQTWKVPSLKDSYFNFVQQMIPLVSFNGQTSVTKGTEQEQKLAQKQLTFSVVDNSKYDLYAMYNYNQFGAYFNVPTSVGGIITSNVIRSPKSPYCESHYNFFYDMNYPLLFQLRNNEQQTPFIMRFALPVDAKRNDIPASELNSQPQGQPGGSSQQSQPEQQSSYCKDTTFNKAVIKVVDNSGNPVPNADASITCGQYVCYLNNDGNGEINSYLPRRCLSGTITVSKDGYGQGTLDYKSYNFNQLSSQKITLDKMNQIGLKCIDKNGDAADCDFQTYGYMVSYGQGSYQVFSSNKKPIYIPSGANAEFSILKHDPNTGSFSNPYDTGNGNSGIDAGRLPVTVNGDALIVVKNNQLSQGGNRIDDVASVTQASS